MVKLLEKQWYLNLFNKLSVNKIKVFLKISSFIMSYRVIEEG
jgi:hypothetical protein